MLKVKLVYAKNNDMGKYGECSVTGISFSDWFCCLLFKDQIPDYVYSDIMEEFLNDFHNQITKEVYEDIEENPSAIIYMYNPMTKNYEVIYKYS